MSISRRSIIIFVVLVLLAGGIAFALIRANSGKNSKTPTQNPDSRVTEDQVVQPDSNGNSQNVPSNYQGTSQISISLSSPYNGQVFGADEPTIAVRAILNGTSSGTCTLLFTKSGYPDVTKSAPVIQAPTYYTCQGFDIAKSELPSGGEWVVKLSVKAQSAEGSSEQRTIVVN